MKANLVRQVELTVSRASVVRPHSRERLVVEVQSAPLRRLNLEQELPFTKLFIVQARRQ